MEAPDSPPPAKRARRFVSPRGKQSGGFAWLAVFEILYYVIVWYSSTTSSRIWIYAADPRYIRGSATLIRPRISLQIYIYMYMYTCTCTCTCMSVCYTALAQKLCFMTHFSCQTDTMMQLRYYSPLLEIRVWLKGHTRLSSFEAPKCYSTVVWGACILHVCLEDLARHAMHTDP